MSFMFISWLVDLQIENEYGFVGGDLNYVRHLVNLAQGILGKEAILYTTDPPPVVQKGSLPGDEVFTCARSFTLLALYLCVLPMLVGHMYGCSQPSLTGEGLKVNSSPGQNACQAKENQRLPS